MISFPQIQLITIESIISICWAGHWDSLSFLPLGDLYENFSYFYFFVFALGRRNCGGILCRGCGGKKGPRRALRRSTYVRQYYDVVIPKIQSRPIQKGAAISKLLQSREDQTILFLDFLRFWFRAHLERNWYLDLWTKQYHEDSTILPSFSRINWESFSIDLCGAYKQS